MKGNKRQENVVHKKTKVGEILTNFPEKLDEIKEIMATYNMECIGYGISTWHTLEKCATEQSISSKELERVISLINQKLEEEE